LAVNGLSWQEADMSRIHWPDKVVFKTMRLEPEPEERLCAHCGGFTYVDDNKHRFLRTLDGPVHVINKVCCCPDRGCPGHAEKRGADAEMRIAPPFWTVSWDLFAWMGHRRFARHWSVPQIVGELWDRYGVEVSADVVEDYTAKYEAMVAARESDFGRLAAEYRDVPDLLLSIDGLQPEKGHETLYVVRELRLRRVWFAEPLLSSAADEVRRLFERARDWASRIDKPVRGWISDKQQAFVVGVQEVFPGVPHRYCENHFLRDAAKLLLESDSHAKVQMRRKVRGLRDIERRMLSTPRGQTTPAETGRSPRSLSPVETAPPNPEGPAASLSLGEPTEESMDAEARQVVLDYCAAVRGILNDDQGGPLHPPGVRMAGALGEVQDSIGRAVGEKKGGRTRRVCRTSPTASNEGSGPSKTT